MITSETRHQTASMVILDEDRVLLVLHKASGKWVFPGGHVDPDEALHEAAIREVLEETGIRAEVVSANQRCARSVRGATWHPTPFQMMEFPAPAKPDRPSKPAEPAHRHLDALFLGRVSGQADLTALESEVDDAQWVKLDDLGRLDVRHEVPRMARAARKALDQL